MKDLIPHQLWKTGFSTLAPTAAKNPLRAGEAKRGFVAKGGTVSAKRMKGLLQKIKINYSYDAIGNIISNAQENRTIQWNVYGKVKRVNFNGNGNARHPYLIRIKDFKVFY